MAFSGDNVDRPIKGNKKPLVGTKPSKDGKDKILINPNLPDDQNDQAQKRVAEAIAATCLRDDKEQAALEEKAVESGIPLEVLEQVYERGIVHWFEQANPTQTAQQTAFNRVSSFINGGKARSQDEDLIDEMTLVIDPARNLKQTFANADPSSRLRASLRVMKKLGVSRDERLRQVKSYKQVFKPVGEQLVQETKMLGVLQAMDAQRLKPEQLMVGKTKVRTRVGGMRGTVHKVYEHPIKKDWHVHFVAANGKKYRTSLDNMVKEEEVKLDEAIRRRQKTGNILNHVWLGKRAISVSDGSKVGVIHRVTREPTFSQLVPYVTNVTIKHEDGTFSTHRKHLIRLKEEQVHENNHTRNVTQARQRTISVLRSKLFNAKEPLEARLIAKRLYKDRFKSEAKDPSDEKTIDMFPPAFPKRPLNALSRWKKSKEDIERDKKIKKIPVKEAKSYFSVRDKSGNVQYMGGDYNQANSIRKRVLGSRIHRHSKVED